MSICSCCLLKYTFCNFIVKLHLCQWLRSADHNDHVVWKNSSYFKLLHAVFSLLIGCKARVICINAGIKCTQTFYLIITEWIWCIRANWSISLKTTINKEVVKESSSRVHSSCPPPPTHTHKIRALNTPEMRSCRSLWRDHTRKRVKQTVHYSSQAWQ